MTTHTMNTSRVEEVDAASYPSGAAHRNALRKLCMELEAELARLREREKLCPTLDEARKIALIRALQEVRDVVGLLGDGVSPKEIVAAVHALRAQFESAEAAKLNEANLQEQLNSYVQRAEAAEARVRELEAESVKFQSLNDAARAALEAERKLRDMDKARLAAVLGAIPFPALSAGTAESLAYPLEQTGNFGSVTNEAAAAWLRDIAAKLRTLGAARSGELPSAEPKRFEQWWDERRASGVSYVKEEHRAVAELAWNTALAHAKPGDLPPHLDTERKLQEFIPHSTEPRFYIYAKQHSRSHDYALWWNPGGKGYTHDLSRAGLFTEKEARDLERGSHGEHIAIPESVALSAPSRRCVEVCVLRDHIAAIDAARTQAGKEGV
jgi:hypothetical protein